MDKKKKEPSSKKNKFIEELKHNTDVMVAERIKYYRELKKRTQDELAKYLGLTKQAVSRIEKVRRKVSFDELDKIALFLDEPVQAFIREDYKYSFPYESEYDVVVPVFMADFLKDYYYFVYHAHDEKIANMHIKNFKWALDYIQRMARNNKKFDETHEKK